MEKFDLSSWPGFNNALRGIQVSSPIVDQIVIDSRRVHSHSALFVALEGEHVDGHQFVEEASKRGAIFALVKEDFKCKTPSLTLLRVASPLRALQEIALSYRKTLQATMVAIGGSYGKTLTKDLLFAILSRQKKVAASPGSFNSQIGVPLSLFEVKHNANIALIEAGISNKGEMVNLANMIRPDVVILTKIAKTHLPTLKNLKNISEEMMMLGKSVPKEGSLLIPFHPHLLPRLEKVKGTIHFWNKLTSSLPHAVFKNKGDQSYTLRFPSGKTLTKRLSLSQRYFLEIINIAAKAAFLLGCDEHHIIATLKEYLPESMQKETWITPQGATFVRDVYSADPFCVSKALKNLPKGKRTIFLFGGLRTDKEKMEEYYPQIAQDIRTHAVEKLILFGKDDFSPLLRAMDSPQTEVSLLPTEEKAILHLRKELKPDDVVLLKGTRLESLDNIKLALADMMRENQLIVNLSSLRTNIALLRSLVGKKTRIMVMLKANAYGTDALFLSKFYPRCGIDIFGVAHVDEALELQAGGVTDPIFVINASPYDISKLLQGPFEVGVGDLAFCKSLNKEAKKVRKKIKVHLHIDTGMSRLGARPEEALALAKGILSLPFLTLEGVMTHLAAAECKKEDIFTKTQIEVFKKITTQFFQHGIHPTYIHAANSSGALRFSLPFCNMVRVGLAPFGLVSSSADKERVDLKHALTLRSHIAGINICKKGESVSYGRTYTVERKRAKIGVIPLGYFDGLHRHYSGKGYVLIRGHKAPMIGKICMDFMMVDITDIPGATVGDAAVIFGKDEFGNNLPPEQVARWGKTNVNELITCLGPRIQRIFIDDEK